MDARKQRGRLCCITAELSASSALLWSALIYCLLSVSSAAAAPAKIKVQNPIVEMDGDEMTR
jgi:hypothetical protein